MNELEKVIIHHYSKRPKMQLVDAMKLLYQNEFGCGHLVTDKNAASQRLLSEWHTAEGRADEELFEDIGNGFVRMNIAAAKYYKKTPEVFCGAFLRSAAKQTGTIEGFIRKAEVLRTLCHDSKLPFSAHEVDEYLKTWTENSCMPFSHSEIYRIEYSPAYRVAARLYTTFIL